MKIKRFTAASMQEALRLVTLDLGADAMIVSSKKVPQGMEIVAALDYQPHAQDEAARQLHLQHELEQAKAQFRSPVRRATVDVGSHQGLVSALTQIKTAKTTKAAPTRKSGGAKVPAAALASAPEPLRSNTELSQVQQDLQELKVLLLQTQSAPAKFVSQQFTSVLSQHCQELGLLAPWTNKLLAQIQTDNEDQARLQLHQLMLQELPISAYRVLDKGGCFALVGPTGAGKTTTIGKIAAHYVMQHGPEPVALITLDNYRVAAHDQLRAFARILGVELHVVAQNGDLHQLLERLAHKKLVLVDSAGLASQDPNFNEQLNQIHACGAKLRKLLVLPLTSHGRCLEENYQQFKNLALSGCILTKLDESFSLGAALSVAALTALPITLITDGPHIPDDIHYPDATKLVKHCEQMAQLARAQWQSPKAYMAHSFRA